MATGVAENLNEAQKKAVEQADGPLLIIAGAGTGKTKVITSRILHLLLDKKIPANQILALTFTEKATEEMVERVDLALPLSYEEIAICTFHGFCDRILRERGVEIGIDPGFTLLNQTEQWLWLKKNLFSFELNYYRPLGNPNKFLAVLLNHFSRLKDEDISPDAYILHAEKLLKNARDAADDAAREEAVKTLEIARAYATYQRLMQEQNFLDFGDLQYYALRMLEKRPSVLKEYQDRYRYILVDEFQDTNFAQNKLVMMLAAQHKNLTVVGDDDQSIYKWRGASLSNILKFEQHFPDAKKIVLTENYRSPQNILDVSYGVIQNNNPYRLEAQAGGIQKKLRTQKGAGMPVEIWHFSSYLEEARQVAAKITELAGNGECSWKNFAILVRANQQARAFVEALKDADIPFTVRDTQGLLRFEEIKDLLALLRFLVKPHDDIAFFRLLSLPIFQLPVRQVLDLTHKAKLAGYEPLFFFLRKFLKKDGGQKSLPGVSEEEMSFESVYDLFDSLLGFTRNNSVSRILGEFLDKSGYYKDLTAEDTLANSEKIQHVAQFMELARDFESENGENSVRSFLEYLEMMEEAQGVIAALPASEDDAVSILTVHSAKGLEFDYVFLPGLVSQRFPSTNRRDPIEIPEELIAEELPSGDVHIQEERRLFYVACTRARELLFLSYSDAYEGPKKWKVSPFVREVLQSGHAVKELDFRQALSADNACQGARAHAGLKQADESAMEKKILHVPEINVKQLSYSKIDTFETCPLKYKFRYIFEIPSPSPHAANFGSSVHATVNEFYERLKSGGKPSPELLNELYDKHWICGGYDSLAHEQARKKKGREIMEKFYASEEKNNFKAPAFLERPFSLKIGDMRFTGRIDRIDKLEDGSYEVVDYKTGTYKKDANLAKDLQLSLYALACKAVFQIPVSKLSLYFLEDGKKISTARNDEDLQFLKDELTRLSAELRQSQFLPTPGFHCGFCEYKVLCHAAA